STGAAPVTVPGAAEHVHRADELEHAARLRRTLAHLPTSAPITVVGGGLTGIETAGELAARGRTVRLVCGGTLAPSFGPPARAAVQRQLAELGVEVLETALVTEIRAHSVTLDDGAVLASTVTVWAGGFAA